MSKITILTYNDNTMEFEVNAEILDVIRACIADKLEVKVKGSSEWGLPAWFELKKRPDSIINEGSGCEGVKCEKDQS